MRTSQWIGVFFWLAGGLGGAFAGGLLFDRIIAHVHENYFDRWEAMGRPTGFIWRPSSSSPHPTTLREEWIQMRVKNLLFWGSLDWAPDDARLRGLVVLRRAAYPVSIVLTVIGTFMVFDAG